MSLLPHYNTIINLLFSFNVKFIFYSHHAKKKDIGAHEMMAKRMGNVTAQTIEARKYNMTLQEFSQWKQQKEGLVKFSNKENRGKRKKGEINHFGNFPLNGVFSFGAKFVDMDDDSFPDLIISGDFGTSQMLWNNRNKTFHRGFFHVIEDIMDNSMGCTVGDWDQDGKTDIMFTSVSISLKGKYSSEGARMEHCSFDFYYSSLFQICFTVFFTVSCIQNTQTSLFLTL